MQNMTDLSPAILLCCTCQHVHLSKGMNERENLSLCSHDTIQHSAKQHAENLLRSRLLYRRLARSSFTSLTDRQKLHIAPTHSPRTAHLCPSIHTRTQDIITRGLNHLAPVHIHHPRAPIFPKTTHGPIKQPSPSRFTVAQTYTTR